MLHIDWADGLKMDYLVRNLLKSVNQPDVIQGVNRWRQATVQAEYLIFNQGSQR